MKPHLLHQLLAASAANHADGVAVVDGDRALTYRELDERSSQLAHLLRASAAVRRGDRVALLLDKSIEAVVAIYGVLKAGAAYVPLDPGAPTSRLGYVVADCAPRCLISTHSRAGDWVEVLTELTELGHASPVVALDYGSPPTQCPAVVYGPTDVDSQPRTVPASGVTSLDLAYILYTSGSTGRPKGVMHSHRSGLAFVEWAAGEFGLIRDDRVSGHAPLHFDLSIFDLFASSSAASTLVLVPPVTSVFASEVRRFIESQAITVWYSVPSVLSALARQGGLGPGDLPHLRTVLFAGEVFPTQYLRLLMNQLPHARFANLYGPTETNVCTWFDVPPLVDEQVEAIPIGRVVSDDELLVVSDEGSLAAPGEVGELWVRGGTVMLGYWGDPDRTARSLLTNPVGAGTGGPVYRTGDLVVEGADGNLRFLGRRDNQVKSRGYRIELGDIEAALHAHPAVAECAAVAVPDPLITNRLMAFVVLSEPAESTEIRRRCSEQVPGYMVPESIHIVPELPKTSTGKLDRRALVPEQTTSRSARSRS